MSDAKAGRPDPRLWPYLLLTRLGGDREPAWPDPETARSELRLLVRGGGALLGPPRALAEVRDLSLPVPGATLRARLYRPHVRGPLPLVVYFHGGGWAIGDLDTHDPQCRALADTARALVLSVDYRLAPEHRAPTAAEDAYAATVWAATQAGSLGARRGPIAVCGDSAGGNLAAVVALLARDRGGAEIGLQILAYPVIDARMDRPSFQRFGWGYGLSASQMRWFWEQYAPRPEERMDPRVSPIAAPSLAGLPPALVLTAELDVLRDEAVDYVAALRAAGTPVEHHEAVGAVHGYLAFGALLAETQRSLDLIGDRLASALGAAR